MVLLNFEKRLVAKGPLNVLVDRGVVGVRPVRVEGLVSFARDRLVVALLVILQVPVSSGNRKPVSPPYFGVNPPYDVAFKVFNIFGRYARSVVFKILTQSIEIALGPNVVGNRVLRVVRYLLVKFLSIGSWVVYHHEFRWFSSAHPTRDHRTGVQLLSGHSFLPESLIKLFLSLQLVEVLFYNVKVILHLVVVLQRRLQLDSIAEVERSVCFVPFARILIYLLHPLSEVRLNLAADALSPDFNRFL